MRVFELYLSCASSTVCDPALQVSTSVLLDLDFSQLITVLDPISQQITGPCCGVHCGITVTVTTVASLSLLLLLASLSLLLVSLSLLLLVSLLLLLLW